MNILFIINNSFKSLLVSLSLLINKLLLLFHVFKLYNIILNDSSSLYEISIILRRKHLALVVSLRHCIDNYIEQQHVSYNNSAIMITTTLSLCLMRVAGWVSVLTKIYHPFSIGCQALKSFVSCQMIVVNP